MIYIPGYLSQEIKAFREESCGREEVQTVKFWRASKSRRISSDFPGFRRISPDFVGLRKFDFWSEIWIFVERDSPMLVNDEDLIVLIWFHTVWALKFRNSWNLNFLNELWKINDFGNLMLCALLQSGLMNFSINHS